MSRVACEGIFTVLLGIAAFVFLVCVLPIVKMGYDSEARHILLTATLVPVVMTIVGILAIVFVVWAGESGGYGYVCFSNFAIVYTILAISITIALEYGNRFQSCDKSKCSRNSGIHISTIISTSVFVGIAVIIAITCCITWICNICKDQCCNKYSYSDSDVPEIVYTPDAPKTSNKTHTTHTTTYDNAHPNTVNTEPLIPTAPPEPTNNAPTTTKSNEVILHEHWEPMDPTDPVS